MNARFNLKDAKAEKTKLMLIIRDGHERKIKIYTDLEVAPKDWDNSAQSYKNTHPFAKLDSERLLKWRLAAAEAIRESELTGEGLEEIKLKILSKMDKSREAQLHNDNRCYFLPYYYKWCNTPTTKREASKYLMTSYNRFSEFAKSKNPTFDEMTVAYIEEFIEWMARQGLSINTRGSHIKRLKAAMREAYIAGMHTNSTFRDYRKEQVKVDNIYLTEDEIRKIEDVKLKPGGMYTKARDLFIIGCHTALRYSDCIRITPDDIHDGIIRLKQVKTGGMVMIPCHPRVSEIIERYDGAPKMSDVVLNRNIKEVCRLAGITDKVGVRKHGEKETTYYEKWELVSSHTARRSAATNMYKAGIPTIAIMKITGHKSERVFMDYIKITNEENARMLKNNAFFNSRP